MNLLDNFRKTLQAEDLQAASTAVLRMKKQKYPFSLIRIAELELQLAVDRLSKHNLPIDSNRENKLPYISPSNYLLHRPDLQAAGFTVQQAQQHLSDYGLGELAQEAENRKPQIRRYLDLNDTPTDKFWLITCVRSDREMPMQADTLVAKSSIPSFTLKISNLSLRLPYSGHEISLQEFASWARLRMGVHHFCMIDQTDILADGWQYAYQEPLQNNINSIFYCQEYIDFDQAKPTKFSQHNRQYKSKNSPFRLYTRGYISGIVAVPTPKISAASLEASYQSTWCLQVDLCQQYSDSIKEISQPLLLRHQRSNPCIPEYSTIQGRSLFAAVKDEFFHLASKNIQKFYSGHYKPIARLTQSSTGEIAPLLTRDTKAPKVSVVIPFRDQVDLLEMCIKSLLANEKICELELLLADNGSVEDATRKLIEELTSNTAVNAKHIRIDEPFNFSRINNIAAAHFTGDYILLLNNDIEFRSINPIASMASYFLFNNIGAVGSRLLYEDGSIQHQGIVITPFEPYDTYSPFKNTHQSEYDYSLTSLVSADQWSAATAACLLIDRDTWINSQGLDENLVVAYNDIDLCLRICESGKAVLVDPSPSIIHFESKSRGHDLTGYKYNRLYQEAGILRSKHAKAFSAKDEFWPQLLSISNPRATPAYLDAPELASFDSPLSIIKRTEGLRQVDKQAPLNVCIYVNYNASNRLRPDIIWQLEELSKHYAIIFVTTCSLSLENDPLFELLTKHAHRILFRENIGYDFGSWKCGILDTIDLIGDASSLLLMNDSLYGPITPMTEVIEHTLFAEEDFICMTLNNVGGAHAQSYFVSYKPSIFLSADFTAFWKTVPVYADKYQLIKNCEMNWSHFLLNTNKSLKALFDTGSFGNQTHVDWRKLILEYDCPFIKNELIHKNPVGQDINDIESILAANSILYKQMLAFWQETDESLAFTPCQSLASA